MILLKDILNEAKMHAYTQQEALRAIWQLKIDLKSERDIIKLLDLIEKKIKAYEPR